MTILVLTTAFTIFAAANAETIAVCSDCNGKGFNYEMVTCRMCDGTGHNGTWTKEPGHSAGGNLFFKPTSGPCRKCAGSLAGAFAVGSGKVKEKVTCKTCNGKGRVVKTSKPENTVVEIPSVSDLDKIVELLKQNGEITFKKSKVTLRLKKDAPTGVEL